MAGRNRHSNKVNAVSALSSLADRFFNFSANSIWPAHREPKIYFRKSTQGEPQNIRLTANKNGDIALAEPAHLQGHKFGFAGRNQYNFVAGFAVICADVI